MSLALCERPIDDALHASTVSSQQHAVDHTSISAPEIAHINPCPPELYLSLLTIMNRDQGHRSESYSDLYSSMGNNVHYVKSGDMEYDIYHPPSTSDPTDIMDFVHTSVSITLIQE